MLVLHLEIAALIVSQPLCKAWNPKKRCQTEQRLAGFLCSIRVEQYVERLVAALEKRTVEPVCVRRLQQTMEIGRSVQGATRAVTEAEGATATLPSSLLVLNGYMNYFGQVFTNHHYPLLV